jgi:hypothetical protein
MYSALLIAVVSIGIAAVFGSEAAGYPPEARRLPMLLAWIVIGLAVLMTLEEALKGRRRRRLVRAGATDKDEMAAESAPVVWSALIPFAIAIGAYIALIPVAGYLMTTPVFLSGVLLVSRTVRPLTALAIALVMTGCIWLIFVWLLRLPIPLLPLSF